MLRYMPCYPRETSEVFALCHPLPPGRSLVWLPQAPATLVRRPGVIHGVTPPGSVLTLSFAWCDSFGVSLLQQCSLLSCDLVTVVTRFYDGRHTNLRRSSHELATVVARYHEDFFVSNSTVENIGK